MTVVDMVVAVLVPLWLYVASQISRNGREVSELRGRIGVMEKHQAGLVGEVANAHRRIGGADRTANQTAGEMRQVRDTLATVQLSLIGQGDGGPARDG